jgi:hypothetical protein
MPVFSFSKPLEQFMDPGSFNQMTGQNVIQRRQGEIPVLQDFGEDPPMPKRFTGP